ncbi:MerR family transcriptional regulator [Nocardia sp. NBC_00511]|uniref:MerR family transcriptional regulator n=1 Tax=Nocardia sp. NBC_00511 TaxID=2903591 RepID=UPI0030E039A6
MTVWLDVSVKVKSIYCEGAPMLIGELAEQAGVTTRMVRHYANAGLLANDRNSNGYRDFGDDQVVRVRQIQALLGLGLTVAQISDLLPCLSDARETPSCPAARRAFEQRLHSIDAQIDALSSVRSRIAETLTPSV